MKDLKREKVTCILICGFLMIGFLTFLLKPHETYSNSERRPLAEFPKVSVETIGSGDFMTGFEKYATDAVPFRDFFRSVKALSAIHLFQRKDNNGIYVKDGYAAKMEYPLKEASFRNAAERFEFITKKYLTPGHHAYLSLIPDKNFFLSGEGNHLSIDYEKAEKIMTEHTPSARYIKISDLLRKKDYYKTDTHWRQENLLPVAEKLAKEMGVTIENDFLTKTARKDFLGVYVGQSALPLPGEDLNFLVSPGMKDLKITDFENSREIGVSDEELAKGRDGYEMFLSGSLSLIKIENPKVKNGKKLVIFRDSFGSSLAPLLTSAYSEITLVDIRYISSAKLERFIDFKDSDILFLYSMLVLNNSDTLK